MVKFSWVVGVVEMLNHFWWKSSNNCWFCWIITREKIFIQKIASTRRKGKIKRCLCCCCFFLLSCQTNVFVLRTRQYFVSNVCFLEGSLPSTKLCMNFEFANCSVWHKLAPCVCGNFVLYNTDDDNNNVNETAIVGWKLNNDWTNDRKRTKHRNSETTTANEKENEDARKGEYRMRACWKRKIHKSRVHYDFVRVLYHGLSISSQ